MRAAVFRGPGEVVVEDVDAPRPAPGGIVLAVEAAGICGSDLHLFSTGRGITPPQVLGHEFAGRVVAAGPEVRGVAVGDRVAAMPIVPCGACDGCRAGAVQLCVRAFAPGIGVGLPGAFAEHVHVPVVHVGETVFPLPDAVSAEGGALLEPLAVAAHAVRLSGAREGDRAAVLGLGTIGHLVARVLLAHGVEVAGVERQALRRDRAAAAGVEVHDGHGRLRDAVGAPELVFECTGVPALAAEAVRTVRRGGTVMIVAIYEEPAPVDVSLFGLREVAVRGSSAYASEDFAAALELVASGAIAPAGLVTERIGLDDLPGVLAREAAAPQAMKVLVEPGR